MDATYFESPEELRAWLEEHHATSTGIWAVYGKKSAGERWLPYEQVVHELLCYGWIDSLGRGLDETRTQLLITPRRRKSQWSEPNRKRVAELEATGLLTEAGRAAFIRYLDAMAKLVGGQG